MQVYTNICFLKVYTDILKLIPTAFETDYNV